MSTIKDVAKRAGVAPSTVSYALSGKRPISEAVQQKIQSAIKELDYTPSALGRNLRQGQNRIIGMVFPLPPRLSDELNLDFFSAAATAVQGSHTISLFTHLTRPKDLIDTFRKQHVDGLIVMQITRHDPRVQILEHAEHPFVLIGRPANAEGLTLVDFEFEAASYQAIAHLVELGHRVIGYIDLPPHTHDPELGYVHYLRQGYQQACQDFDVTIFRQVSCEGISGSYAATTKLLTSSPKPTAIVALKTTHLGVLRALHDHHQRVPDDVSVVCVTTTKAEWTIPSCTSVDVPLADLGRVGAELMVRKLSGEPDACQIILPAKLTVRESTAPPAG